MSGVKGRSGRKPLTTEEHLLRGTFRADRHKPLADSTTPLPAKARVPPVPASVLTGLHPDGHDFVARLWQDFESWSASDQVLLHLIGQATDRTAEARAALKKGGLMLLTKTGRQYASPWLKVEQNAVRELVMLFRQLGLESS